MILEILLITLRELLSVKRLLRVSLGADHILFDVVIEGKTLRGVSIVNITATQKFTATIRPVNSKGSPARVDGVPTWASSDPSIADVTPAADGLSAVVIAQGEGDASITVSADADLGAGVKTIIGQLDVTVTPGQAVSVGIETGPVSEQ